MLRCTPTKTKKAKSFKRKCHTIFTQEQQNGTKWNEMKKTGVSLSWCSCCGRRCFSYLCMESSHTVSEGLYVPQMMRSFWNARAQCRITQKKWKQWFRSAHLNALNQTYRQLWPSQFPSQSLKVLLNWWSSHQNSEFRTSIRPFPPMFPTKMIGTGPAVI